MYRHRFDPLSFTTGLLFTVLGVLVLADQVTAFVPSARWILPTLALVAGVAFLASAGRRSEAVHAAAPPPAWTATPGAPGEPPADADGAEATAVDEGDPTTAE